MQTTVTSNRRLSGASVARPQDTQWIPMFKITPADGKKPSLMIVATKIRSRWPPRTDELPPRRTERLMSR